MRRVDGERIGLALAKVASTVVPRGYRKIHCVSICDDAELLDAYQKAAEFIILGSPERPAAPNTKEEPEAEESSGSPRWRSRLFDDGPVQETTYQF